jgi:hypothetical protein
MSSEVKYYREKLEARIAEIQILIKQLQGVCPHDNLTYKYGGDSGNYDRSQDEYWIDWHCNDCEKRWTTSQENSYHLTTVVYPQARRIQGY